MDVFVYILYSSSADQYYVGYSKDLKQRLEMHQEGVFQYSFTSKVKDWKIYYSMECETISQARRIESHIKRMKSRKYIEDLTRYPDISQKLLKKYK